MSKYEIGAQSATSINTQFQEYGQGWTNNILVYAQDNKKIFYIPSYMRTKLTNIVSIDVQKMIGEVNVIIKVTFYYGNLRDSYPKVVDYLQNKVLLRFKMDPTVQLKPGFIEYEEEIDGQKETRSTYIKKTRYESQSLICFVLRKKIKVPLNCTLFFSPFEYIEYPISIFIQSIRFSDDNLEQKHEIHFNLMNLDKKFDKNYIVAYTKQGTLGEYDLAEAMVKVDLSNKRFSFGDNAISGQIKNKHDFEVQDLNFGQQDEQALVSRHKVISFHYGHFVYPVYRKAMVPLFALFFPIVMLGFLNVGVFFQTAQSGKRMLNIATILVSYIAFLPNIRQNLPPASNVVISEILMFGMASLTILALIDTISLRNYGDGYEVDWQNRGLFIAALVCTIFIVFILVCIAGIYLLYFYYKVNRDDVSKPKIFRRNEWVNERCDAYFKRLRDRSFMVERLDTFNKAYPSIYIKDENKRRNYISTGKKKRMQKQQIEQIQSGFLKIIKAGHHGVFQLL